MAYMKAVALYKFDAGQPLFDKNREQLVLEKAVSKAETEGLSSKHIKGFFVAQMNAAKAIQYRYMAEWMSVPPEKSAEYDLIKAIRANIIKLGTQITSDIASYLKSGNEFNNELISLFNHIMDIENLSAADKKLLFKKLQEIRLNK